jgi:hypothetical protein
MTKNQVELEGVQEGDDESVTGFTPTPSLPSDHVEDAAAAFAAVTSFDGGHEVEDPRDGLTEDEQQQRHHRLQEIARAQSYAETLTGVRSRR